MAGRTLAITYVGDAKSALAAQKQIDAGHTGLQSGVKKTGSVFGQVFGAAIPLSAVAAGAAVVALGKTIITAASDEGEAVNKAKVIFGDATDSVLRFSDTSASSFGIAKAEALSAAAGFGAMAQSAGVSEGASAKMSVSLVKLAGDMASFNNEDPSAMLERLRSGLAGEAEPLRQFGVFISEARVQTEAYASGIAKAGEELTDAQKIQARYNIIQQDTAKQAGDFGRTLGESLPNQIRVLKAEFIDLAAAIGQVLLPTMLQLVKVGGAVIENIDLLIAAAVGFVAWKVLPALFLQMALGLERIKLAAGANAAAGIGAFVGAMGPVAGLVGGAVVAGELLNDTFYANDVSASQLADTIDTALVSALAAGKINLQEYRAAVDEANAAGGGLIEVTDDAGTELAAMQQKAALAESQARELGAAQQYAANEIEALTEAAREQRLAILGLSNEYLGIFDSANAVSEAQRELNRLERLGKEDTKAYEQAVLDALEAQIGLEDAVLSYGQELIESGTKQKAVEAKVRDLGKEFGLTKDVVRDLIAQIHDYINELDAIPEHVNTNITTTGSGGSSRQQLQHGGIVTRPTVALIGEAGPEAVIPLSKGGGMGATVNVYVEGSVIAEDDLVEVVRRGLLRTGSRNGDIFGGIG